MVYCTECGFANNDDDAFCTQCGTPLEHPAAAAGAGADRTLVDPAQTASGAPGLPADAVAAGQVPNAGQTPVVPMPPLAGAGQLPAMNAPITSSTAPTVPAPTGVTAAQSGGSPAQTASNKRSAAIIVTLIALICATALVIGLFVTHTLGLWGGQPGASTSQAASGGEGDGSASDGTADKDKKSSADESDKDTDKDEDEADASKTDSQPEETGPVITSSQLSAIADQYSSSDVAVSAMVINDESAKAKSSSDAVIATTSQSGKQFVAAGLYLPVYLAAMDSGNDDAKAQAATMMGTMDNASGNNVAAALGGWDAVNAWASSHGYSGTSFSRNYGDVAASNSGYENYSSSRDAALMLASVDAKGGTSLMNVDIAAEGVVIPAGMTVHAHRGQGIQDTWNYFAIVEANGHKAAVSVVTQYQGKAVAADLMSKVLASVDATLKQ